MSTNKKLIIMCGPAGSGKTTWVQDHASAGVSAHISRDRIRFDMLQPGEHYFSREDDVYAEFVKQVAQALTSPWVNEVYADATHLTEQARMKLVYCVDRKLPQGFTYDLMAVAIIPPVEVAIQRNAQRTGRACVPETVIRNMYNSFEDPWDDENLSYTNVIYGEEGGT